MRKRRALKKQRRPAMPRLKSGIFPWSMQWKPALYAILAASLLLTLGFHNVLSSHWSKYASHRLSGREAGIEIEYPDTIMQVTDERTLSDSRYIILSSKIRETAVKRPGGLYSAVNDSDQIEIKLSHQIKNKRIFEYEKEIHDHFSQEPMRVNYRKYKHSLGEAIEVTLERMTPNSSSQEPLRYVLILSDPRSTTSEMSISASCVANPKRSQEFTAAFERVVDRIRIVE